MSEWPAPTPGVVYRHYDRDGVLLVALLAFIGGMWWVAENLNPGAANAVIAGVMLLPFAIAGVWMTR